MNYPYIYQSMTHHSPLSTLHSPTPAQLGFRMPAEWEPHAATWLAWPHNRDTWPGMDSAIAAVYVQLITALHQDERVHICVNDPGTAGRVR